MTGHLQQRRLSSLRNMEKKCKNLLSDKDLCTEHDGRVRKNGEISGEWSQG